MFFGDFYATFRFIERYFYNFLNTRASCETLKSKRKSSFRASEARPGIQDFRAILDSGFRRNDGISDFCKKLKGYLI